MLKNHRAGGFFVETAGIEPASESSQSWTSTYIVYRSFSLMVLRQTKVIMSYSVKSHSHFPDLNENYPIRDRRFNQAGWAQPERNGPLH